MNFEPKPDLSQYNDYWRNLIHTVAVQLRTCPDEALSTFTPDEFKAAYLLRLAQSQAAATPEERQAYLRYAQCWRQRWLIITGQQHVAAGIPLGADGLATVTRLKPKPRYTPPPQSQLPVVPTPQDLLNQFRFDPKVFNDPLRLTFDGDYQPWVAFEDDTPTR